MEGKGYKGRKMKRVYKRIVKDAIKNSGGIITNITTILNDNTGRDFSLKQVRRMLERYELQEEVDNEKQIVYDLAHEKLVSSLKTDKIWAIKEVLRQEQAELNRRSFDNKDTNNVINLTIGKEDVRL